MRHFTLCIPTSRSGSPVLPAVEAGSPGVYVVLHRWLTVVPDSRSERWAQRKKKFQLLRTDYFQSSLSCDTDFILLIQHWNIGSAAIASPRDGRGPTNKRISKASTMRFQHINVSCRTYVWHDSFPRWKTKKKWENFFNVASLMGTWASSTPLPWVWKQRPLQLCWAIRGKRNSSHYAYISYLYRCMYIYMYVYINCVHILHVSSGPRCAFPSYILVYVCIFVHVIYTYMYIYLCICICIYT